MAADVGGLLSQEDTIIYPKGRSYWIYWRIHLLLVMMTANIKRSCLGSDHPVNRVDTAEGKKQQQQFSDTDDILAIAALLDLASSYKDAPKKPTSVQAAEGNKYKIVEKSFDKTWIESINKSISEPFKAAKDLWSNYQSMKEANTIGADKYFHCVGHCEASREGSAGVIVSQLLGDAREVFDFLVKLDSRAECRADLAANQTGRSSNSSVSCKDACSQFRPKGLNPKY